MRSGTTIALLIAAVAIAGVLVSSSSPATAQFGSASQFEQPCRGTWWIERGSLALGEALPHFGFSRCDGEEVTTSDLKGKPVLINFWATWCKPCRDELPNLNALAEEAGDELAIVGISLDRSPEDVRAFIEQVMLDYDITWDGGGIARDLGIASIPLTLAVDAEGNVVGGHQGYATKEQFTDLARLAGAEIPEQPEN